MAKDAGIDAMPKHLQAAATILQEKLQELITSAGESTSTDFPKVNPTGSLKRILDTASPLLVAPGDDHAAVRSRREGSKRVAVEVCRHSCAYHEELMDPSLWGSARLPKTGLYGIFARLPLQKIISLQILSQEWKEEIHRDGAQSEFLKLCDKVHQKVALITRDKKNLFWVRLLDVTLNQWHAFQISAGEQDAVDVTAASEDGGLVCFVSTLKKPKSKTFIVDVVNPLTKTSTTLPPLKNMSVLKVAQIVVEGGKFMVLAVGDDASNGELVAQVCEQDAKTWSNALTWARKKKKALGVTFGYAFHLGNFAYRVQKRDTPCGYDFAEKSLLLVRDLPLEDGGQCPLAKSFARVKSFAQLENRIFVLLRDRLGPRSSSGYDRGSAVYYIVEYSIQMQPERAWVETKTHACRPFDNPPKAIYDLSLFACKGYLMVLARLPEEEPYKNEVAWLYNLATCKWSDLPKLPGEKPYDVHDLMCGLYWNTSGVSSD